MNSFQFHHNNCFQFGLTLRRSYQYLMQCGKKNHTTLSLVGSQSSEWGRWWCREVWRDLLHSRQSEKQVMSSWLAVSMSHWFKVEMIKGIFLMTNTKRSWSGHGCMAQPGMSWGLCVLWDLLHYEIKIQLLWLSSHYKWFQCSCGFEPYFTLWKKALQEM